MVIDIPDEKIIKKFKLKEKQKYEYLKKTIKKYIIDANSKYKSIAEALVRYGVVYLVWCILCGFSCAVIYVTPTGVDD